jgi:hypothetical protein
MVHCLKSDELQFVDIFSANKVATLCSADLLYCLLNCITETIQVTKGHRYIPRRPRDGQRTIYITTVNHYFYYYFAFQLKLLTPDHSILNV